MTTRPTKEDITALHHAYRHLFEAECFASSGAARVSLALDAQRATEQALSEAQAEVARLERVCGVSP